MFNIKEYLKRREEWVIMVLKHNVLKTIWFKDIIEHIRRIDKEAGERKYFLIKCYYTKHFYI